MTQKALLEEYLGQLKLPTFAQNYEQYAQDASRGDSTHEQYLLALCEAEIAQRKVNRIERAIAAAKYKSTFEARIWFLLKLVIFHCMCTNGSAGSAVIRQCTWTQ